MNEKRRLRPPDFPPASLPSPGSAFPAAAGGAAAGDDDEGDGDDDDDDD